LSHPGTNVGGRYSLLRHVGRSPTLRAMRSSSSSPMPRGILLLAATLVLLAAVLGACGDDDGGSDQDGSARQTSDSNRAQRGFLQAMVPHHESAVEMANVAKQRAERRQIERLAVDIVAAQSREIKQMERIHRRIFRSALKPDANAHEALGLSAKEAGMHEVHASAELERAKEFDRAFIDAMVPHHQGAIRMAHAVMAKKPDAEIAKLAESIIEGQSKEIERMNSWRMMWYGRPSPAGGVPEPGKDKSLPPAVHEGHG
jgi:uncharacterized protein (DUF305 family)